MLVPFDENKPTIEVTDEQFAKIQQGLLKMRNWELVDMSNELDKQARIAEIQAELTSLSQDFTQAQIGAVFDDLEARKERFKTLHNELRTLLGKEERKYADN